MLLGQVQGGQHLEVGAHRGQRGAQLVRRHRGEVAGRRQRVLGAVLLLPDALEHDPCTASAISTASVAPRTSTSRCLVAGVDRPGLLGQPLERPHRERGQQPARERRAAPMANTQMRITRRCRLLVSAMVASYVAPTATDIGPRVARGSPPCAPGSAPRRRRCRRTRAAGRAARRWSSRSTSPPRRTVMMASWSLGERRDLVEPARQERDREAGRLVEPTVQPLLAVVGDADPHDGADDARTTIAAPMAVANATRVRSDGVRRKIRDRSSWRVRRWCYCCRRTNPTPRTVCSSRGAPPASSLRRR